MSKLILQIALLFKIPITLSASFIEVLSSVTTTRASFAYFIEFKNPFSIPAGQSINIKSKSASTL